MIKRYSIETGEMVAVSQEYFDSLRHRLVEMTKHYNKNSPTEYENFCDNYLLNNKKA